LKGAIVNSYHHEAMLIKAREVAVRRQITGQMLDSLEVSEFADLMADRMTYQLKAKVWTHEVHTEDQIVPWSAFRTVGPTAHHRAVSLTAAVALAGVAAIASHPITTFTCVMVGVMVALTFSRRIKVEGNTIVRAHTFNAFPDWPEVYPPGMGDVQQLMKVDPAFNESVPGYLDA
jgi:hypothetical protein